MASSSSYIDDSDDEFYNDGCHKMTPQQAEEYYRAYEESDGFDVPYVPRTSEIGLIVPLDDLSYKYPLLQKCAEEAIKQHNMKNDTKLEFVKILKANEQGVCGILYYITFEVKSSTKLTTETFQAQVLYGIPPKPLEVLLCRPKPSN